MLLGLLAASVLAADRLGCAVLAGDLVDDDAVGVSGAFAAIVVDDWTDDPWLVCVVVVDGDWLVRAKLPDDWPSGCDGTGLLCDWTNGVLVVE